MQTFPAKDLSVSMRTIECGAVSWLGPTDSWGSAGAAESEKRL